MKHRHLLIPFALLTSAATAAPPSVKVIDCTADGANNALRIRFGVGEYSEFDSATGQWGANLCVDAKDCKFKGPDFVASLGPYVFFYNTSTAHYIRADLFGDVTDRGKCVPE